MKLSLVVPVFNEEEMLALFYRTVRESEALASYEVEIVIVNDGSSVSALKPTSTALAFTPSH